MRPTRWLAVIVLVVAMLLLLSVSIAVVLADEGGEDTVTEIEGNHALVEAEQIQGFETEGAASADLEQLDATVTVAKSKRDVDVDHWDAPTTTDVGNHYLRIQYEEDISRTIRIWIPAEYIAPYERAGVESITSEHTADYSPVRDRAFLEVVVHLDGEADVVLPMGKLGAGVEGTIADRVRNLDEATGGFLATDREWTYLEGSDDRDRVVELDVDPGNALIQFDAADDHETRWINAPEGDTRGAPVYYHVDGNNESVFLVITTDEQVDIRYTEESTFVDEVRGAINDARHAAETLPDRVRKWLPESPFVVGGLN